MSIPSSTNNELIKLKAALNDLEKKKKTPEYSNLTNEGKKSFTELEKATRDLFEILSKVN